MSVSLWYFEEDLHRVAGSADRMIEVIARFYELAMDRLRRAPIEHLNEGDFRQCLLESLDISRPSLCMTPVPTMGSRGDSSSLCIARLIVMGRDESHTAISRVRLGSVSLNIRRVASAVAAIVSIGATSGLGAYAAAWPIAEIILAATESMNTAPNPPLQLYTLRALANLTEPTVQLPSGRKVLDVVDVHQSVVLQSISKSGKSYTINEVHDELVRLEDLGIVVARGSKYWRLVERIRLR